MSGSRGNANLVWRCGFCKVRLARSRTGVKLTRAVARSVS
jgi:hypothetical protein